MAKKSCQMIPRVIDENRLRVYIAGPLSASTPEQREAYIDKANQVAKELVVKGQYPYCPHTHSCRWFEDPRPIFKSYKHIVEDYDILGFLSICDAIYMLPGWRKSKGTMMEYCYAKETGKKIFFKLSQVPNVRKPE